MGRRKYRRGISKLVSTIILLAMVIAGAGIVWKTFSSNMSAYSSANIGVSITGSYNGTAAILKVTIRNSGGSAAIIKNVTVDGVDITGLLGAANYTLAPGSVLQKVVVLPSIGPGNYLVVVTYLDRGSVKQAYSQFSI